MTVKKKEKKKKEIVHNFDAIDAELCKRSFYFFVQYFWTTIIGEEPIWNWHIKYLCDEMQAVGERVFARLPALYDYYIINVPPGSSKSTICSEMYPIWCWTNDPTQRFICGSYSSTAAEELADKSYKIYTSDKFKQLFPHLHGKKRKGGYTHFHNGLLGERFTTSTGSTVTGFHAHQKIIDDPMNPQIAASKAERTTSNKWVGETLSSRDVNTDVTVTFLIMQRLHELDTTGYLLKKKQLRIKHICIPIEVTPKNRHRVLPATLLKFYDDNDGLFDPVRRPRRKFAKYREDLGSYGFAGQLMQDPAPLEGGIIKKHWFLTIDRIGPNATSKPIKFQMDTAYTDKTENDPTGIVAYYREGRNIYLLGMTTVYKEIQDLLKWLPGWVREFGYDHRSVIKVEPKASGKSVVQLIRSATNLNISEDEAPTDDKLTRLTIAAPKIEAGRVIIHANCPGAEDFVTEVCTFPNAEHDEYVDIISAIVRRELLEDAGIEVSSIAGAFA